MMSVNTAAAEERAMEAENRVREKMNEWMKEKMNYLIEGWREEKHELEEMSK